MSTVERRKKLIELISSGEIDTQEELARRLNENGFDVTQATVSRDIKTLGIVKVSGEKKKYRYSYTEQTQRSDARKLFNIFKATVTSVVAAQNLVVVKTLQGGGLSAGALIDKMQFPEIVGCIGGEDTIIIVTKSNADALAVEQKLKELL